MNTVNLMLKNEFYIISAGKDLSIKIWDFRSIISNIKDNVLSKAKTTLNPSEQEANLITVKNSLRSEIGHDEEIMVVKVAPNEKIIASGSFDKLIKVTM